MKIRASKKLFIGVIVLLTALPFSTQGDSHQLSPQEMGDWRYPAILCRDAVLTLTLMTELEKIMPGGTDLRWEADPEHAILTTAVNVLGNQITYDNVFDREMVPLDGFRTSILTWELYHRLKRVGYKLVDNEKLPIDAFDLCVGSIEDLLS